MEYPIRTATRDDYQTVEGLLLELNRHHVDVEPDLIAAIDVYLPRRDFEAAIRDPKQEFLLLEAPAGAVGVAWLVERKHEGGQAIEMPVAFVQELCVGSHQRGLGYGRLLMAGVERWARDRQLARIEFNVWARNRSAISFYERLGFGYARHEMYKLIV